MSRQEVKPQDIDAILTQGQILSGPMWKFTICLLYSLLGILLGLFIFFLIIVVKSAEYDSDSIATIIGVSITLFVMTGVTILLQCLCNSGKKKARLLLADAAILEANAESKGTELQWRNMWFIASAIEVTFVYDGKRYVRQSLYKGKPLHLITFNKYVGKRILIAYSPKYDEVMLIRPRSAKAIKEHMKK